jgi:hypothetical protein
MASLVLTRKTAVNKVDVIEMVTADDLKNHDGNNTSAPQDQEYLDENALIRSMSSLLKSMRLFGLYFTREDPGMSSGKNAKKWNPWYIHAIIVLVLLWLNFVRILTVFTRSDSLGPGLFNKLAMVAWMLQCAVAQTAFFIASYTGKLDSVLRQVRLEKECAKYARKTVTIFTVSAWTVSVIYFLFLVYMLFFSKGNFSAFLTPFTTHIQLAYLLPERVIVMFFNVYLSISWVFPQAMTLLLATIFSHQFSALDKRFRKALDIEGNMEGIDIETFRREHHVLCRGVKRADRFVKVSIAGAFMQLAIVIFMLYNVLFYTDLISDPFLVFVHVAWIMANGMGLTLTAASGIMVNNNVSITPTGLKVLSNNRS